MTTSIATELNGEHRVAVTTDAVMTDLDHGAQFIGPDGATLYEITLAACDAGNETGWVYVRNLSLHPDEVARRIADREVEPGTSPRDGVFAYTDRVTVDRVIALVQPDEVRDDAVVTDHRDRLHA